MIKFETLPQDIQKQILSDLRINRSTSIGINGEDVDLTEAYKALDSEEAHGFFWVDRLVNGKN